MGRVRIVAGNLRGRRIDVPDDIGIRPTPDRVREALFSILGARVSGARIADLYAGSGALGFEALSRGALHVTFVEADPRVRRAIVANAALLGVSASCRITGGSVPAVLIRPPEGGPFDLVLADPPYDRPPGTGLPDAVYAGGWLSPGGLLVLERESRCPPPAGSNRVRRVRTARYGRVSLDFYEASGREGIPEEDPGAESS